MKKHTEIGNRLKKLRANISQKDFAKKIGVSYAAYQRYEYGERIPPSPVLSRLADMYHVTTDWILTGKHKKEVETDMLMSIIDHCMGSTYYQKLICMLILILEKGDEDEVDAIETQLKVLSKRILGENYEKKLKEGAA